MCVASHVYSKNALKALNFLVVMTVAAKMQRPSRDLKKTTD